MESATANQDSLIQAGASTPEPEGGFVSLQRRAAIFLSTWFSPVIFDGSQFWGYCRGVWSPLHPDMLMDTLPTSCAKTEFGRIEPSFFDSVLKEMASMSPRAPYPWNPQPRESVINTGNGVLDVLTMEFSDHAPDHFSKIQIPTNYDPDADCPAWMLFLETAFAGRKDLVEKLQKFMGYCLLSTCRLGKWLFMWGVGATGKSTMTSALAEVLGPDNTSLVGLGEFQDRYKIASLQGRLVNFSREVWSGSSIAASSHVVKSLVKGESVMAAIKCGRAFLFQNTAKLIVESNTGPNLKSLKGLARNMIVVPFAQQFSADQQIPELFDLLRSERSGMLNWMIKGARSALEKGF